MPHEGMLANAEIFAAYVRGCRSILGWSQTELGNRVGLSQRSVHRIEIGKVDVRYSTAMAILDQLQARGLTFKELPKGGFAIMVESSAFKKGRRRRAAAADR